MMAALFPMLQGILPPILTTQPSSSPTPAFVQGCDGHGNNLGGSATFTCVFGSNVGSGHDVVCAAGDDKSTSTFTATDGNSATYTVIHRKAGGSTAAVSFINVNNSSGTGSKTITVTASINTGLWSVDCQEISGASISAGTGAVDIDDSWTSLTSQTGTNAVITTAVTTTQANDYLFGAAEILSGDNQTWTAGTLSVAWTLQLTDTGSYHASEWFVDSGSGSGRKAAFTVNNGGLATELVTIVAIKHG